MSWFFIALGAPILWAATNHIDKLLLEKYLKRGGVGALMIFSSITGILTLPVLYYINSDIFEISVLSFLILIINGLFAALILLLYFKALEKEEASIVVVFYQLIPLFGYLLGYFILDEILTRVQLLAMVLIITGAAIISFEIDAENKFKLRRKTILLMTTAAFIASLESVLFKFVAVEETLAVSLFWEYLSLGLVGIVLFLFIRQYRQDFLYTIRINSTKIFSLNMLNEVLYIGGNLLFAYSFLLAPIALVLLVNSYQPLAVFMIGVFLTLFFPKLGTESIQIKHLVQKGLAVIVVGIGTYILLTT